MALEVDPVVLLGMVVGGVGAVVLGTVALGWNAVPDLDPDRVRAAFDDDLKGAPPHDLVVADDRRTALLDLGDSVGLALALGDRVMARTLPGVLRSVRDGGDHLLLAFADLGIAPVRVRLANAAQRERWRARLVEIV